uniref:F-box domain-containing protein n=1 Tax=Kalmanozyma brasiliensis (strain GHG001) TaxID=1365824 RepID=V5EYR3_KALBG
MASSGRRATINDLPTEILREIVGLVWLDSIPKSSFRNIDPHGLPSSYPDGRKISSTQTDTRKTLYNLCLVNKAFYHEARVLLFRRIQITLPHSFNLLLRTLGASHLASAYEKYASTGSVNVDPADPASFVNMVAAAGFAHALGQKLVVGGGSASTPPVSRDEDGEVELIWTEDATSTPDNPVYHVTLREENDEEDAPLHKWVRLIDFSNFRTQGMRRTIGEGIDRRFVTPARLLALVTAAEGLVAFGASETMDSALSNDVLEALLFRDGEYSKPSRMRGVSVERNSGRSNKMLQSLDLCECVSPRFHDAMKEFVETHLKKFSGRMTDTVAEETESSHDEDNSMDVDEEEERGRGRSTSTRSQTKSLSRSVSTRRRDGDGPSRHPARPTAFPSLNRLGLSGVTLDNDLLNPFVLAFPRLTHLDLSRTKADAALLNALSSSHQLQLESLSLAFCKRITSESVTELLVDAPCTQGLVELSLAGTLIFPTAIDSEDLKVIITQAPCFRSGKMRYLDLGGCALTDELLGLIGPQPSLLDLGLSHCPDIKLEAVSKLLRERAPNVQILELSDSCTSRSSNEGLATNIPGYDSHDSSAINAVHLQSILVGPCAKTPPIPISVQLAMMGFKSGSETPPSLPANVRAATNLRVVGLNSASLQSVRGGFGTWKVIRGAGRRGWVVDTAAGPNPEASDEALVEDVGAVAGSALPTSADAEDHSPSGGEPMRRGRSVRYDESSLEPGSQLRVPPSTHSPSATRPTIPSIRRAHSVGGGGGSTSRSRSRHIIAASYALPSDAKLTPRDEVVRDLPADHPRRRTLQHLADCNGHVTGDIGWHSRKMEVLLGFGFLGRETGLYALPSFQV